MEIIICRLDEKLILEKALKSNEPELIAIYGRRQVGKTYLVRQYFAKHMLFDFSGVNNEFQKPN